MKLILGTRSKFKKYEMEKAGFVFEVMSAEIDEKAVRDRDLYKIPELVASAKADTLLTRITEPAILVTSDAVVVCNNMLMEKPTSAEELKGWCKVYEKYPTDIVSGVCVVNTATGKRVSGTDISKVVWGPIDENKLDEIIAEGEVFLAAGFNEEMKQAFATYADSVDRLRGVPIELITRLISEVEEK